jgi:hypothetical protein
VVAVESLLAVADEVREARAALQAGLPPRLHRELDGYLARTVDASQDLKEVVFRGGARGMLQVGGQAGGRVRSTFGLAAAWASGKLAWDSRCCVQLGSLLLRSSAAACAACPQAPRPPFPASTTSHAPSQAMLDQERGIAVQIGATNYALKDHATSYSPWAQEMQRHYAAFRDALAPAALPDALKAQMWEHAIAAGEARLGTGARGWGVALPLQGAFGRL